ncbi:unnamed protein product [Phytophthora fragariaefolia]|uniref:Unnamed protein product n=1 Tax=Phytophthora fragariaefolia TaxID=1490495 RepID=A0A9W7CVF7_9STRA|nr:unnamed protein product [Phytophthora fragariaefolia]
MSGSPPADTAPAVSPTTATQLAPSAAETAGPNSLPSSGQPGGQASTLLTPPSAPRAGAESASTRSPTPVTAESSTEPEDSAVGSTSPPLSSATSAPTQPTSVSLGLLTGADDSLSSPPELQASGPPMVLLPCSVSLRAPLVEVAAWPRFPDARPSESAEERDEFFQQASPTSALADSVTSSGEGLSTPPRTPRSIFRRRLDEKPFLIVESSPKPSLDALAMPPVSPVSPIRSPTEVPSPGGSPVSSVVQSDIYSPLSTPSPSPQRASVPPGFQPGGLLEAGVPPLPKLSPVQAKPVASSPVRRSASPPSTSLSAPSSASPAGSPQTQSLSFDSCQQLVDHLRRMADQRDKDLKRMSEVLAERDVAYSALQGVASSYFEQVQEAAAVISSGGADRALRFANQTIDNQPRVIQRQKNVLRHNGRISVTDPALALAAAAGIDAPGLSPGDLALNARRCRLLETRWPELSQVQPSEVREITLRVSGPVAPSSAPVSLPLSSATPTSNSSAAGLAMTPADRVPSA